MLVFDSITMTFTRFTLAKGLLNEGYYEMAREEILKQITRQFGKLSAEQLNQVKSLSIPELEALEEALLDFAEMADLDEHLGKLS
jgi:hypothetical protein